METDDQVILDALEVLGVALAAHDHQWTNEERRTWNLAFRITEKRLSSRR